jgi:hypothetical protein
MDAGSSGQEAARFKVVLTTTASKGAPLRTTFGSRSSLVLSCFRAPLVGANGLDRRVSIGVIVQSTPPGTE